jgi:hypothetical protein
MLFCRDPWKTAACYSAAILGKLPHVILPRSLENCRMLFCRDPWKIAACYSAAIRLICAELEGDIITVSEELNLVILQSF